MKCDYCSGEDHLVSLCPSKSRERRMELILGILFIIPVVPFYIVGWVSGMAWSALRSGFQSMKDFWKDTATIIKGREGDE